MTEHTNGHSDPMEEITALLEHLPDGVKQALEQRDTHALSVALASLPEAESQRVVAVLEQVGIIRRRPALEDMEELPADVRTALENQDLDAFNAAMNALPSDKREVLVAILEDAGYIQAQPVQQDALVAMLPDSVREALANQDLEALQTALKALPDEQQEEALSVIEELQKRALDDISIEQLISELPESIQQALEKNDEAAIQMAFGLLDVAEQQHVMHIFELIKQKS